MAKRCSGQQRCQQNHQLAVTIKDIHLAFKMFVSVIPLLSQNMSESL